MHVFGLWVEEEHCLLTKLTRTTPPSSAPTPTSGCFTCVGEGWLGRAVRLFFLASPLTLFRVTSFATGVPGLGCCRSRQPPSTVTLVRTRRFFGGVLVNFTRREFRSDCGPPDDRHA